MVFNAVLSLVQQGRGVVSINDTYTFPSSSALCCLFANDCAYRTSFLHKSGHEKSIKSETIGFADKGTLDCLLAKYPDNEIIYEQLKPFSPMLAVIPRKEKKDVYLPPKDHGFVENIIYNWRSKIESCYDPSTESGILLVAKVALTKIRRSLD